MGRHLTGHRRLELLGFLIATAIALALYLPFRSIQWDINGLSEAWHVETGTGLFNPNHLLNRPLGRAILVGARSVGYEGRSAHLLQVVTAACGALGIGIFFVALHRLTGNSATAALGALFLATSWSYWRFSTDISYMAPAALCVAGSLVFLMTRPQTPRSASAAGLLVGCAVLLWQANMFLVPATCGAVACAPQGSPGPRARLRAATAFLVSVALTAGLTYLAVATVMLGHRTLGDTIAWAGGHGSDVSGRSPMWGHWGADRVRPALTNAVASFIPVWKGLGLRKLLDGDVEIAKLLPQLSLAALAILLAWTAWRWGRSRERLAGGAQIGWLLLAYLSLVPFIIWWEPFETRWFIVPNVFFVAACARIWSGPPRLTAPALGGLAALVLVIAAANWTSTIRPSHDMPSVEMQRAACFSQHVTPKDAFIVTDWTWYAYSTYFFGYKGQAIGLRRGANERSHNIDSVARLLADVERSGGQVYVTDLTSYTAEMVEYFSTQVGIPLHVLDAFAQEPAFTCQGLRFARLAGRQ